MKCPNEWTLWEVIHGYGKILINANGFAKITKILYFY